MPRTRTQAGLTGWTAEVSGPFFTRDPRKVFRENVKDFMDEVARVGEAEVLAGMRSGEAVRRPISSGVQPARVRAHVVGRTTSLRGKRWQVSAVVSVSGRTVASRKQAIALRAAASEVERQTKAFSRASSRINRVKKDLAKGLN